MYATDGQARAVADAAVRARFDTQVDPGLRPFFYLPFMHSEELSDLDRCVALNEAVGDAEGNIPTTHLAPLIEFVALEQAQAWLDQVVSGDFEASTTAEISPALRAFVMWGPVGPAVVAAAPSGAAVRHRRSASALSRRSSSRVAALSAKR